MFRSEVPSPPSVPGDLLASPTGSDHSSGRSVSLFLSLACLLARSLACSAWAQGSHQRLLKRGKSRPCNCRGSSLSHTMPTSTKGTHFNRRYTIKLSAKGESVNRK